jgi:sialate O-acetylesterase
VWGMARPGEAVMVKFHEQTKTAKADGMGRWRVNLDPMAASARPASLLVSSGDDALMMCNVLVGDVWFCSGQSNMEYSMRKNSKFEKALRSSSPPNALDSAHNPDIRIFLVRPNYSKPDYVHIRRAWDVAAGAPLRDFSAAGYFFARDIYGQEHVPIGMISNAVPGSQIEPFLPGGGAGLAWRGESDSAGKFYKTIVEPLAPYALKGFLWYQGESNCFLNDTARYPEKMKALITGWRKLWESPELPFYYVQIAPFYYSRSNGGNQAHSQTLEPAFWEAQAKALELPHTGMVVTTDLVDSAAELHPPYKWEVGRRLALWALAKDYHQPVVCSGPTFESMTVKGRTIVLSFANTGSGLISNDGKPLDWFEVAGADGKFTPANAVIEGADKIVIKSKHKPMAVRFGWNEAAQPNLFNKEGLPAMPFRATVNESR